MENKICFEALDRTLRDILRHKNENSSKKTIRWHDGGSRRGLSLDSPRSALDRTLRDILRHNNENNSKNPFGGMTVVLGGDFR